MTVFEVPSVMLAIRTCGIGVFTRPVVELKVAMLAMAPLSPPYAVTYAGGKPSNCRRLPWKPQVGK